MIEAMVDLTPMVCKIAAATGFLFGIICKLTGDKDGMVYFLLMAIYLQVVSLGFYK